MSNFCETPLDFIKLEKRYLPGYFKSITNLKKETRSNFESIIYDIRDKLILIKEQSCNISGSDDIFRTFSVSGQSDIVASGSNDTITFLGGTDINITTNSVTKTITINSTSGNADNFTEGSVLFGNTDGTIEENNDRLYWKNNWDSSNEYYLQVDGNIQPKTDDSNSLGTENNRFSDLYAVQTTIGAFFETGLRTKGIGDYDTGTVVSWEDGKCVCSYKDEDELVMGVVKKGKDEPIILGAEYVLVTGKVDEGDYLVTSGNKRGHCKAVKRGLLFKKDLFGKVIAQALESSIGDSKLIKAMIRKM